MRISSKAAFSYPCLLCVCRWRAWRTIRLLKCSKSTCTCGYLGICWTICLTIRLCMQVASLERHLAAGEGRKASLVAALRLTCYKHACLIFTLYVSNQFVCVGT
jgi:hypothetical protein